MNSISTAAKLALVVFLIVYIGEQPAKADSLINGDFSTGNLTGWTTFTTANGTLGIGPPNVALFDTNNDGIPSLAAQFRVGQVTFMFGVPEGGGIFQSVNLLSGQLSITADIAAQTTGAGNEAGGLFQLLLDGTVIATHDFGVISSLTNEFSSFSATVPVTNGSHEIRLLVMRPFLQRSVPSPTPVQYIDNVVISGSATVPEPGSFLLFASGLAGLACRARWRRKGKRQKRTSDI